MKTVLMRCFLHCKTFHKKKIVIIFTACLLLMTVLVGRLFYLMVFEAEYYQNLAKDLHERERSIKAARGRIIDRTGFRCSVKSWGFPKRPYAEE